MELILFGHTMTVVLIWGRKNLKNHQHYCFLWWNYKTCGWGESRDCCLPLARLPKYSHSTFVSRLEHYSGCTAKWVTAVWLSISQYSHYWLQLYLKAEFLKELRCILWNSGEELEFTPTNLWAKPSWVAFSRCKERSAIQRDWGTTEEWAKRNLMKFIKGKILYLIKSLQWYRLVRNSALQSSGIPSGKETEQSTLAATKGWH